MARTAQLTARGFGSRVRVWGDVLGGVKRRLFEGLGMLLVLASLLLLLALLTYNPGDASLNTAVAVPARNYLGHDGAVIADLLIQSVGLAGYLVPAALVGWALRLMLQRPIQRLGRRFGLLLAALLLGAVACSVLHPALPLPAGAGGAVGWAVLRLIEWLGLAALALPVAMMAAAVVALLLLSVIGLSPGDWRDIGNGAGRGASRVARASGRSTVAAAQLGHHLFRRWRDTRRAFEEPPVASSYQAVIRRGAAAAPRVTPLPDRREPRLGPVPAAVPPQPAPEPERIAGRLARLVMPRTKSAGPGK